MIGRMSQACGSSCKPFTHHVYHLPVLCTHVSCLPSYLYGLTLYLVKANPSTIQCILSPLTLQGFALILIPALLCIISFVSYQILSVSLQMCYNVVFFRRPSLTPCTHLYITIFLFLFMAKLPQLIAYTSLHIFSPSVLFWKLIKFPPQNSTKTSMCQIWLILNPCLPQPIRSISYCRLLSLSWNTAFTWIPGRFSLSSSSEAALPQSLQLVIFMFPN